MSHITPDPAVNRHVCSMTFVFFLIDYCNPQSFGLQSKLLDLFSLLAICASPIPFPLFGVKKHRCLTFPNICRDLSGRFEWHILLFLPIIWTNVSSIIVNPAPFLLKRKVQSIKFVKKGWLEVLRDHHIKLIHAVAISEDFHQ